MSILEIFVLQTLVFASTYAAFGRQRELPALAGLVTLAIYQTSPMFVAIQGAASSIYVCDLLLPVLAIKALRDRSIRLAARDPIWIGCFLLLLVIPAIAGMLNSIMSDTNFDSRSLMGTGIWFYRNANFLLVLLYGLSLRLVEHQVAAFVRLNIVMAAVLACFGIINYGFGVNLAVFDKLLMVNNVDGELFLETTRIGWGFMGLFRSSVGQWSAIVFVLITGVVGMHQTGSKVVKVSICFAMASFVLFSSSRVAIVAIAGSLVVLAFLGRGVILRVYAILGMSAFILGIFWQYETFGARIESILIASDISSVTRLTSWELGVGYLLNNIQALILGIGPTNESGMYFITGTFGAHNEFIDTVFRMGIFGMVILTWLLLKIGQRYQLSRNSGQASMRILGSTMLAVLMVNIICGVTQSHLLHSYATYTCGMFIYWLYGATLGVRSNAIKVVLRQDAYRWREASRAE